MAYLEYLRRRSTKESVGSELGVSSPLQPRLERWLPILIVAALLIVWEWQSRVGGLSTLFFPAPSVIADALLKTSISGELLTNTGITLIRVILGFVIGGVAGTFLGLLMGWSGRLRYIVDPLIAASHPIPKLALLPIIIIIFGLGETSKVVIIAVTVFFPMLINSMAGTRQISPIQFEVASSYKVNRSRTFLRVVLPGSLPFVLAGARLALNIALLITVAVEMLSVSDGLGAMVWLAWQTLRTEELYASIFVVSVLGVLFNILLQRITLFLVPWQVDVGNERA